MSKITSIYRSIKDSTETRCFVSQPWTVDFPIRSNGSHSIFNNSTRYYVQALFCNRHYWLGIEATYSLHGGNWHVWKASIEAKESMCDKTWHGTTENYVGGVDSKMVDALIRTALLSVHLKGDRKMIALSSREEIFGYWIKCESEAIQKYQERQMNIRAAKAQREADKIRFAGKTEEEIEQIKHEEQAKEIENLLLEQCGVKEQCLHHQHCKRNCNKRRDE